LLYARDNPDRGRHFYTWSTPNRDFASRNWNLSTALRVSQSDKSL